MHIDIENRLLGALGRSPTASAGELIENLGVSQATLSRLLAKLGTKVLKIGRGRSTRYAMPRNVRGLGDRWPIYRIDQDGDACREGDLVALSAGAFLIQPNGYPPAWLRGEFAQGIFPGWPWFLEDMRPQGFLGRAFAHQYASELFTAEDLRLWSDDVLLNALLLHGENFPGNLVIGERALLRSRNMKADVVSAADFPALAARALRQDICGSSAGGEQPKFCVRLAQTVGQGANLSLQDVILKFSPPMNSPAGARWADLLACESIAAAVLSAPGVRTQDVADRRYLIAPRFDRIGQHGRLGVVSLASLDDAHFGLRDNWLSAAERLKYAGWVDDFTADTLRVRYRFGQLIGNTDMHFGNSSFFLSDSLPLTLTPSYDMLPTIYAPNAMGEVVDRPITISNTPLVDQRLERIARELAGLFWHSVINDKRISASFKKLLRANHLHR
jgi:hypothetical protein